MTESGTSHHYDVIVIGGGHAGAEAAWAAANLGARTVLVTMDPSRIGVMSCNPAMGGLAKGQMLREIDALGGLMGLATDATGIQFRMLNASKGPAVQGPRAQCDKYRYAREVQRLLGLRKEITILAGTVESILVDDDTICGVTVARSGQAPGPNAQTLYAEAVVLTTGTFMRGLMHTGPRKTQGGRVGEGAAVGISAALRALGFELGRLKTGTPPRLAASTLDLDQLPVQHGDSEPRPFSDLTMAGLPIPDLLSTQRFPVLEQRPCWLTQTSPEIHEVIRANRDRAPLFNGQIDSAGPRYCPSIEDKVFRFADKTSHHVFLEPESLDTEEIYCNGISTSLPADVQEFMVHHLPGCARAKILRYGYAVEYDMVWPHQIDATGMTKRVGGLFLAGQINGTSGYEEAGGQGLIAGLNAVRHSRGQPLVRLTRDQAYIGVLMDDLVTKVPREPYRMFTSRAEHRLLLRADNAAERLTPLGRDWGLVDGRRWQVFTQHQRAKALVLEWLNRQRQGGLSLAERLRRPEHDATWLARQIVDHSLPEEARRPALLEQVAADVKYAGYVDRQSREIERLRQGEHRALPAGVDYDRVHGLRNEARQTLAKFRPATFGQASRLAGITPADIMVLTVALGR